MKMEEIAELIEIIERSAIEEFELERSGVRIRVRKQAGSAAVSSVTPAGTGELQEAAAPKNEAAPSAPPPEPSPSLHVFTAPIVGTFYITPKPDAEAFVNVGDRVGHGTVLCIIEAMKIFNQIECDVEGEIARILVENGQPVEYGEPLFEIRTDR